MHTSFLMTIMMSHIWSWHENSVPPWPPAWSGAGCLLFWLSSHLFLQIRVNINLRGNGINKVYLGFDTKNGALDSSLDNLLNLNPNHIITKRDVKVHLPEVRIWNKGLHSPKLIYGTLVISSHKNTYYRMDAQKPVCLLYFTG